MTPETATAWLEATARNSGLAFDPDALPALAQRVSETVERDAAGHFNYLPDAAAGAFRLVGGEVIEVPVQEHLGALFRDHAKPIAPPAPEPAGPTTSPTTQRNAGSPIAAMVAGWAAAEEARIVAETSTYRNPWRSGQTNLTNQVLISKYNPVLAARHKAESGQ